MDMLMMVIGMVIGLFDMVEQAAHFVDQSLVRGHVQVDQRFDHLVSVIVLSDL